MSMDEYREFLSSAYSPATSTEDKKKIYEYFLDFKSKVINYQQGCPQEVTDVLQHLREEFNKDKFTSGVSSHKSWQDNIPKYVFVTFLVTLVAGLLIWVITQYISPYFK